MSKPLAGPELSSGLRSACACTLGELAGKKAVLSLFTTLPRVGSRVVAATATNIQNETANQR
jgi:hypothetical protein